MVVVNSSAAEISTDQPLRFHSINQSFSFTLSVYLYHSISASKLESIFLIYILVMALVPVFDRSVVNYPLTVDCLQGSCLEPLKTKIRLRRMSAPPPRRSKQVVHQRTFSEPTIMAWALTRGTIVGALLEEEDNRPLPARQPGSDTSGSLTGALVDLDHYCKEKAEAEDTIITSRATLDFLARSQQLPIQQGARKTRYLWSSFTMYKRIFAFVLVANMLAAITTLCTAGIDQAGAATASAINLSAAIAFRNEHVINSLFRLACLLRPHSPSSIRKVAAKVYSYGGFHSGCATAGTVWYLAFSFLLGFNYKGPSKTLLSGLVILVSVLLWSIVCFAIPSFRVAHHNTFELTHRFAGWAAIAVLWAQVIVSTLDQSNIRGTVFAITLIQTPLFWCLSFITLANIYPWSRLRWRSVRVEVLSPRAALLHFDYRTMDSCLGVRLTDSPLKETHSFATISAPGDATGFRVLMSRAGDWTSKTIDNPPSHIWVKGAPTIGVMRVALLFKKVLVVATGTGIGPCLSLLESRPDHPMHVIWMGSDPRASFGNSIISAVYNADPGACIVDTSKAGRGDILALAYSRFVESGAEAVVIISNVRVTAVVVEGLEGRGIPAYGAIFDS